MAYLPDWIAMAPTLAALIAIVYLPGLVSLLLVGVRRSLAVAFAPAWSCGLVGVSTILLALAGIPWGWPSFLAVSAFSCISGSVLGRFLARRDPEGSMIGGPEHPLLGRVIGRTTVIVVVGLVLVQWVAVAATLGPRFPSQLSDPMFHYNGVNAVLSTGDASMFGALDWNYGLRVLPVTYPSVWHAVVSLVSTQTTILPAAHVMSYFVIPLVFTTGMVSLGRELLPRHRSSALLTVTVSAAFVAFPAYLLVGKGFWPNALAIALLPGVSALALAIIDDMSRGALRRHAAHFLVSALVLAGGTAGMVISHPTLVFTILWVGAPTALALIGRFFARVRRRWSRRRFLAVAVATAIVAGTVLAGVLSHPQVRAALGRPVQGSFEDLFPHIAATLILWPVGQNPLVLLCLSLVSVLGLALGIVAASRSVRTRWLIGAWVMQELLVLGAYIPIPFVSQVVGLWYADVYRLFAIQVIFQAALIGTGLAALLHSGWSPSRVLARTRRRLEPSVGAAIAFAAADGTRALSELGVERDTSVRHRVDRSVVVLVIGFVAFQLAVGATVSYLSVYDRGSPRFAQGAIIGSPEELALLEGLEGTLGDGAIVVGDPLTGIGYAPALSDVDSVFTQFNRRTLDADGNYLSQHFREIGADPAVCRIIRHYGIEYYYQDDPVQYQGVSRDQVMPGFYDVDTSAGFTLVADAGDARLWRIDACGGPEDDPDQDWWTGEWRKFPVTRAPAPAAPTAPDAG
ncbi:hypothetical protein BF93_01435 [Brachybacterium phenoliresistens]|uniref:Beta-carotene 15,15'-monooxygenase n=1 Tax=Brachybacterium phenoliresistens TaxID=396014 RepID=Z9JST3_9MICO|nr:DUF6541 family protein [Brachybacterium phenoliresistens]EWS80861.1 hypothetical protein BF93_01435 [Brachybacterium phenoliresistens]